MGADPVRALWTALEQLGEASAAPELVEAEARAAVCEFLLAPGSSSLDFVASHWAELQRAACRAHERAQTPDVALLAENLPGLVLWRLPGAASDTAAAMAAVRDLANAMIGEAPLSYLAAARLRATAAFGPVAMQRAVVEWTSLFIEIYEREDAACVGVLGPDAARRAATSSADVVRPLLQSRFRLLYDMPFVQAGLSALAHAANWKVPMAAAARRAADAAAPPLARALFAVALVDEYFPDPHDEETAPGLADAFAEIADAVPADALVPVGAANAFARTSHDVRVSAALAYRDPFAHGAAAGSATARVRADAHVLVDDALLGRDAVIIHAGAVVRLLEDAGAGDATAARALARVAERAAAVWDAVQASAGPDQAVGALASAGFLPGTCALLERAVLSQTARIEARAPAADALQAVGCVAVAGGLLFKLFDAHGPSADYLAHYTATLAGIHPYYADVLPLLGLPDGGLEQTLCHCMAPKPRLDYVAATRAALVAEAAAAEERAAGGAGAAAAREALITWFDLRASSRWGVAMPAADAVGAAAAAAAPPGAGRPSDAELARAARALEFPRTDAVPAAVLRAPAFAPHFAAAVLSDVLATAGAVHFSADGLAQLLSVVAWARDCGAGAVANVDGYRTKLSALAASLWPLSGARAPAPTVTQVRNVEAGLGELHAVVAASAACLPAAVRPPVPARPRVSDCAFLASMYLQAAHARLQAYSTQTETLAESMAAAVAAISGAVARLAALFRCHFAAVPGQQMLVVYAARGAPQALGAWRTTDLADAVRGAYAEAERGRASLRVALAAVQRAATQTAQALQDCEGAEARPPGSGLADAHHALLARHSALMRAQTALALAAGKLVSGSDAPGLHEVGRFLRRWDALGVALGRALDDRGGEREVAELVARLRSTWDEVQEDSWAAAPPAPRADGAPADEAVLALMEGYSEVRGDEGELAVLDARANVADWAGVDRGPLQRRAAAREGGGEDASVAAGPWLAAEDLLAEADGACGARGAAPL
ncbi:Capsid assembly protein UL37 [Caprine alphaherpesvirus 1]|uniref:Capsid assembly protein UL37 n=1 Tax=Caprine alphaherpesvirus 1 TaxID=39944 RepID=A0AAF1D1Z6_9ALPH|nr:Capsid assembly protein UL37 [Caprine alphaherpesvirus 1]QBM10863.1 Capsid assembly protein UL37 [Caprine alphaherpesvirus 1]